ncbi:hypothetical protein GIB67_002250, partial [Kingdonia uniflora]
MAFGMQFPLKWLQNLVMGCPPAKLASKQVVKEALRSRGLKDDTTCIVVVIIPPDNSLPPSPPPKKQSKLRLLIFRKRSHDSASKLSKKLSTVGIVEELFEEGSAMLADRLIAALKAPGFGKRKSQYLDGIAILTGDINYISDSVPTCRCPEMDIVLLDVYFFRLFDYLAKVLNVVAGYIELNYGDFSIELKKIVIEDVDGK